MQNHQVGLPVERVSLDVSGSWSVSQEGHGDILVVMDHSTKWAEGWIIPHQMAQTVAQVLVEQFVSKFGGPMMIHTDWGRNFHPQSNGLVEPLLKLLAY